MQMLDAGGIPPLTDGRRRPDGDNPRGYYEFERVKQLENDSSWLDRACGKAVKVISALLYHLPANREYDLIFMTRDMDEILASQKRMLDNSGHADPGPPDFQMKEHFENHLRELGKWLENASHLKRILYCSFNRLLSDPEPALDDIRSFCRMRLDGASMLRTIDRSLYRNKSA